MPVPTKQATPGPSTAGSQEMNTQLYQANSKKRHGSEMAEDTREAKKAKVEGEVSIITMNSKDKKRTKKKKKKRRLSVVPPALGRANFKSRSTTLSSPRLKPIPNGHATSVKSLKLEVHDDGEPTRSSSNKGKGKAQSELPARRASTPLTQSEKPEGCAPIIDQSLEIARLKGQLASQTTLLERHRTHLASQQQSLTCQICLDLLHKPYALAPCGHITCYGCLVRWFTAPQNPDNNLNAAAVADDIDAILDGRPARNGTYRRRRKNCPVCRAQVTGRPVEIWDIKSMVASMVRSELVDLPVPVPPAAEEGSNDSARDPWRNLFLQITPQNRRQFGAMGPGFDFLTGQPPPVDGDREQMGWFDAEDGGIYRCIDCHNEIVDGRCSLCDRRYPGHQHAYDDDDENDEDEDADEDGDGDIVPMHFHRGFQRIMDAFISDEDVDVDDEVDDEGLNEDEHAAWDEMWPVRRAQAQRRGAEYNMYADHSIDEEDEGSDDGSYDYAIPPPVARDRALLRRAVAPLRRNRGSQRRGPDGNAGIVDAVFDEDEDQGDDDDDSQYDGSFIDDDEDHHEGGVVDELDDDDDDDDEVEIVDIRLRTSGTANLRRRVDVLLSSDDNVQEIENPRLLARQLGRRSRQPLRRRSNGVADQDRDMELHITDEDGGSEISEEDEEIPVSRGVVRRLPPRDTDESDNAY